MTSHEIFVHSWKLNQYWKDIGVPYDKALKMQVGYFQNGIQEKQFKVINEVLERKPYYPGC